MKRSWLLQLGCTAIFALSCGSDPADDVAMLAAETAVVAEAQLLEAKESASQTTPSDQRLDALIEYLESHPTGLMQGELRDLAEAITQEADRNQLDLRLVLALMYVESRFQTFVVSPVGAIGLMQILPATGEEVARKLGIEWYGAETLFDPVANVRIGITYVKQLTRRYDKVTTALAAYNWGMGTIDKRLRRGTPVPHVYPTLVMDAYDRTALPVRS